MNSYLAEDVVKNHYSTARVRVKTLIDCFTPLYFQKGSDPSRKEYRVGVNKVGFIKLLRYNGCMINIGNKGTIVSDMNGIIFSFDKNFGIKESEDKYFDILRTYPDGEKLVFEYTNGYIDKSLETEARVIDDILGTNKFFVNNKAITELVKQSKNNKVIFVSLSQAETTKRILAGVTNYLTAIEQEKFLNSIDIYNMNDYGSKKDKDSWKKIFAKYENIIQIYEDKSANLSAAEMAAKDLGHSPDVFTEYV